MSVFTLACILVVPLVAAIGMCWSKGESKPEQSVTLKVKADVQMPSQQTLNILSEINDLNIKLTTKQRMVEQGVADSHDKWCITHYTKKIKGLEIELQVMKEQGTYYKSVGKE